MPAFPVQPIGTVPEYDDQPYAFLTEIWKPITRGIKGIVLDTWKHDKRSNSFTNVFKAEWAHPLRPFDRELSYLLDAAEGINTMPLNVENGVGSIFHNLASRNETKLASSDRGAADELEQIALFAADIDCDKAGQSVEETTHKLLQFDPKPSIIVNSGGGVHVYWLLTEPINVQTLRDIGDYRLHSKTMCDKLQAYLSFEVDSGVSEATRVLRLPGYRNAKRSRKRAACYLLYWSPDTRYTIDQIYQHFPPKPEFGLEVEHEILIGDVTLDELQQHYAEKDMWMVNRRIVETMINGGDWYANSRHDTLMNLCQLAAGAGIPRETFDPHIRAQNERWFEYESHRIPEIDGIIEWGYTHPFKRRPEQDIYIIRMTPDKAEQVFSLDGKELTIKTAKVVMPDAPKLPEYYDVPELRERQRKKIREYIRKKRKRMGTMLLLRTAPGSGKSTIVLDEIIRECNRNINKGYDPSEFGAVVLTQFKVSVGQEAAWFDSMSIAPEHRHLFMFYYGREEALGSPGYCGNYRNATKVAERGHNVIARVCAGCPLAMDCEERHYLSQMKKAKGAWIVVARHQHLYSQQLLEGRKMLMVDEDCLDVIGKQTVVRLEDMTTAYLTTHTLSQFPDECATLEAFMKALREVVTQVNPALDYSTMDAVVAERLKAEIVPAWFGGKRFMDALLEAAGESVFQAALDIDPEVLRDAEHFNGYTTDALESVPLHYLYDLMSVLRYEYEEYYQQKYTAWNSRIVARNYELRIYPMELVQIAAGCKVIVCDGTGDPSLYPVAFYDRHMEKDDSGKKIKAPRPRLMEVYDEQIRPVGDVVQWVGTENTRKVMYGNAGEIDGFTVDANVQLDIAGLEGKTLSFNSYGGTAQTVAEAERLRQAGNPALADVMMLLQTFSSTYAAEGIVGADLLLVTYKPLLYNLDGSPTYLMRWLQTSKVIPSQNIQYFGNLRGKNDWKHCKAVLVVGTPRVPEDEYIERCQIWHWQDPKSLEFDVQYRTAHYNHQDEQGRWIGHRYRGYKDMRLNAFYLHQIQSEVRQCADRIRPNSSLDDDGGIIRKTIYMASAMPCLPRVSELRDWQGAVVTEATQIALEAEIAGLKPPMVLNLPKIIRQVATDTGYTEGWCKEVADRVLDKHRSANGQRWKDVITERRIIVEKRISAEQLVSNWFASNPALLHNPKRGDGKRLYMEFLRQHEYLKIGDKVACAESTFLQHYNVVIQQWLETLRASYGVRVVKPAIDF